MPPATGHSEDLPPSCDHALRHVRERCLGDPMDGSLRVCLHFHPDRLVLGEPILERMGREGVYRSQFETGHSNGGLTAHPGGDRWRWESRIFGGAYDDAPASERPKYGALNFRGSPYGPSPRFGSSYLRLRPHTLGRTTFCYPDSVYDPEHFGVAERMALIPLAAAGRDDPLDEYIEAHVHGPLLIARDVEALVLDPCYRGTDIERQAETLGCPIEWHDGFTLSTEVLQAFPEYRGPQFVALGLTLAQAGVLTPRLIGDASRRGEHDEQALKRVWHYLARFGAGTTFQR